MTSYYIMRMCNITGKMLGGAFRGRILPLFTLATATAFFLGGLHGFALTTNQWINSGNGLWSTGSNWSSNRPPDSTFGFILITNANNKTVTIDSTAALTNLTIQRLTISAPIGSTNTLALANVGTNLPLQLSTVLTVDSGGALTMTKSALTSAGGNGETGAEINTKKINFRPNAGP